MTMAKVVTRKSLHAFY